MPLLDVWDVTTVDNNRAAHLHGGADLTYSDYLFVICNYLQERGAGA